MAYLSAADFLAGVQGQAVDYEVEGVGVVKLKGLTTAQAKTLYAKHSGDEIGLMLGAVGMGLVDPRLSEEQIEQLGDASVGRISGIAQRVLQLSGMADKPALENLAGGGSSNGNQEPPT